MSYRDKIDTCIRELANMRAILDKGIRSVPDLETFLNMATNEEAYKDKTSADFQLQKILSKLSPLGYGSLYEIVYQAYSVAYSCFITKELLLKIMRRSADGLYYFEYSKPGETGISSPSLLIDVAHLNEALERNVLTTVIKE
jgi:hypothetical protein